MFKKTSINYLQILYILIICCFILFGKSYALSPTDTTSINYFDISKKIRIEASIIFGSGSKDFYIFKTTTGDENLQLSPGGGLGCKLSLGYCLSSLFNINLELGVQNTSSYGTIRQKLINAHGSFSRTFLLGTLRYKIPITGKSSINIGGGAGYYMGKLDIDASKIEGGGHKIYEYKDTIGIHVISEYERFLSKFSFLNARWSWCIGLKYYNIAYKLDSPTSNWVSIPTNLLPSDFKDEIKELNGSGTDVLFSIIMHF